MNNLMKFGAISAAVLFAFTASTASAQSHGASPWTGFYVGIHGGYGTANDTNPSIGDVVHQVVVGPPHGNGRGTIRRYALP